MFPLVLVRELEKNMFPYQEVVLPACISQHFMDFSIKLLFLSLPVKGADVNKEEF